MPPSNRKKSPPQTTISLTEINELQAENATLKARVQELASENESLKKQLHDLTDPAKQADFKAFRRQMGYE